MVKRDKMSGLDKPSSKMLTFAVHTSYKKRFNKVLSFVVMGASEDFFVSHENVMYEIMSVCMCVKQQTDDRYIIICICTYSVVINCSWYNNVAKNFFYLSGGLVKGWWAVLGLVTEGGDRVVRTLHLYGGHKGLWKGTATLCRLCALYCGLTVFQTYMVVA